MSDYISRKAAVGILEAMSRCTDCDRIGKRLEKAAKRIDKIPAADVEPVRRWIPCSERMPEELVPVNVVWKNGNPPPYHSKIRGKLFPGTGVFYGGNWYWYSSICVDLLTEFGNDEFDSVDADIKITHWQPISEPPEEENDETIDD